MSFGAIGVEIMAKIKIMRVVIGFTKKEKRKRGNNHVKKEIMDALAGNGGAFKKKEDMHRMAEANKAFAHYKW